MVNTNLRIQQMNALFFLVSFLFIVYFPAVKSAGLRRAQHGRHYYKAIMIMPVPESNNVQKATLKVDNPLFCHKELVDKGIKGSHRERTE